MAEIVLVWWLVLGGSGNAGSSWSPVPYADRETCIEAAAFINQEDGPPYMYGQCVSMPASDIQTYQHPGNYWNG